jgi:hypothetical protein
MYTDFLIYFVVKLHTSVTERQLDGMDLCVPKALASVLYALGFEGSADFINDFGESHMAGCVASKGKLQ